jgi:hypothetical protein
MTNCSSVFNLLVAAQSFLLHVVLNTRSKSLKQCKSKSILDHHITNIIMPQSIVHGLGHKSVIDSIVRCPKEAKKSSKAVLCLTDLLYLKTWHSMRCTPSLQKKVSLISAFY